MDFASYIRDQSAKLKSRAYLAILWDEIEGNTGETAEAPISAINEYTNHLPVLLEQFWEGALGKLNDSDELTADDFDDDLRIYLLVLIYQCMTQSQESISQKCVMHACKVYVKLLTTPLSGEVFKSRLYRGVLTTLQGAAETASLDRLSARLVHRLRKFLVKSQLSTDDLEVTLAALVQIAIIKTNSVVNNFESGEGKNVLGTTATTVVRTKSAVSSQYSTNREEVDDRWNDGLPIQESAAQSISSEAYLCLGALLTIEKAPPRKFMITTYLFNGLRKSNVVHQTPHSFSLVQASFRNLLKSLQFKFKEDDYKSFMNAFVHVWNHPDFIFYGEAVSIMNNLHEKHYKILLDILNKLMTSNSVHRNHFRLALAIVCNPHRRENLEKVKVNNEILIRNILLNCLSSKNDVCNTAVDSMGELLMSPDLQKEYVISAAKKIFNSTADDSFLQLPTILRGLQSLANKKWSARSRNKPLFGIFVSVMLLSDNEYPEIYHEILDLLTDEASPFDLKPFIPILFDLYREMDARNHKRTALKVLKIIFKMALHPMATSSEYVKHLYNAMIFPGMPKGGLAAKCDIYIEPIITEDFNYRELFEKCHTMGLIKKDHVTRLISNIRNISGASLKLLAAIVQHTDYKDVSVIADHINDNFMTECNNPNLSAILHIYDKILKNNSSSPSDLGCVERSNEIMTSFLKRHLMDQAFRWDAVANAFSLLKSLGGHTDLEVDFSNLRREYDVRLEQALTTEDGSFLPLQYFSQLVLFGKVIPSESNLARIFHILRQCSEENFQKSEAFNPTIWIGCLLLYTNICVMKNNLVESGLNFLQVGLRSNVTVVKLASINMMFDLCNMVTHNFEDLINFMFQQLVCGDNAFKRTCLTKIDRLVRDDYLKLEIEQFVILFCVLGDCNMGLGDYLARLLSEHFFVLNTGVIAKFYVQLVVHVNGYQKHPVYKLAPNDSAAIKIVADRMVDKRKIYALLLNCLTTKAKFGVVYTLAMYILDYILKGTIKLDHGYWDMVKDTIFLCKQITVSTTINDSEGADDEEYYKKVMGKISRCLVNKADHCQDKANYTEFHKEITHSTTTLFKLLFSDGDSTPRYIKSLIFDALIHWTDYLLADLIHLIHGDRCKEIHNLYIRFEAFYKANAAQFC